MDSPTGFTSSDSDAPAWIATNHPARVTLSVSSSSSSSSSSSRSDESVLLEMESGSDIPIRAPLPFDEGKSELYSDADSAITLDAIRDLPPYLKAQCHATRQRHINARQLLKDLIEVEERFISESGRIHRKYFPLRVGTLDRDTIAYINSYRKEIGKRVRFHRVIQGRMKRQFNHLNDVIKGRRGSKAESSLPPILTCDLCNMCGTDSESESSTSSKKVLEDSKISVCSNRDCESLTCLQCAYKIEGPVRPCPFCRSPLAAFPTSSGFLLSRDEYRKLHGSLFPEYPLQVDQMTTQSVLTISTSTSHHSVTMSDLHHSSSSSPSEIVMTGSNEMGRDTVSSENPDDEDDIDL